MARTYRRRNRRGYRGYLRRGYSRRRSIRGKRFSRGLTLKSLAYKLGLVHKGLKNPDSQISDAYNHGLERETKQRKSLF